MLLLPQHSFCLAKGPAKTLDDTSSLIQIHVLDSSHRVTSKCKFLILTSPTALVINSVPCLLGQAYFMYTLDKTLLVLTKTQLFLFEFTNPTLVQECQHTLSTNSNTGMCPRSPIFSSRSCWLSPFCLDLPIWSLQACHE